MKKYTLLLTLLLMVSVLLAQNNFKGKYISMQASYMEIKDQINHGFVFKGPDVVLDFGVQNRNEKRCFEYSLSLGGGGKTAIDTWGFRWNIIPVKTSYALNFHNSEQLSLYAGPSFTVSYSIQNYPDMHTGHLNWITDYSLGVKMIGLLNIKGKDIRLQFENSLLSQTSRPGMDRDQYNFSLKFRDVFSDIHSNMAMKTFNKFTRTALSAEVLLKGKKRIQRIAYVFEYIGYFEQPKYKQLSHGIKYTVYLNKVHHENK